MTMPKPPFTCPHCGNTTNRPEWNPYDGIWECYECGEDMEIEVGPRDAEFSFSNQNPEL